MYTLKVRKSEGAALPKMKPHFHRESVMDRGAPHVCAKAHETAARKPLRVGERRVGARA
jgi:hypothetical protein